MAKNYVDKSGLTYFWAKVRAKLDLKVDKVSGKGLSSNDYTSTEKTKLSGISSGAQVNSITGVKGSSESSYRTGNVNLTPGNIGAASSGHTHSAASSSADGFMSATDKAKLDGIATGANAITVDSAMSSTSTNPVQNKIVNTAIGKKVTTSGGSISATKISTIDASTASYPTVTAGDTAATAFGKINKFFADVKNWMTGVCLIGSIVNNCTSTRTDLPVSAAQAKNLMDLYTQLYSDLNWITIGRATNIGIVDNGIIAQYNPKLNLVRVKGQITLTKAFNNTNSLIGIDENYLPDINVPLLMYNHNKGVNYQFVLYGSAQSAGNYSKGQIKTTESITIPYPSVLSFNFSYGL